jgi:hypothetical protein
LPASAEAFLLGKLKRFPPPGVPPAGLSNAEPNGLAADDVAGAAGFGANNDGADPWAAAFAGFGVLPKRLVPGGGPAGVVEFRVNVLLADGVEAAITQVSQSEPKERGFVDIHAAGALKAKLGAVPVDAPPGVPWPKGDGLGVLLASPPVAGAFAKPNPLEKLFGLLVAGVVDDAPPPNRLEPPVLPPPKAPPKGVFAAGVPGPALDAFAVEPNSDGADPPDVLFAPNGLPLDVKLNDMAPAVVSVSVQCTAQLRRCR